MNIDVYQMDKGRMSLLQYYLTKLAEEACEVSQIALKTQQFGPIEVMSGQPLTNFDRVHLELNDLLAVVQVLNDKFNFGFVPDPKLWDKKKEKMERYLELSTTLGYVTPTLSTRSLGDTENPAKPAETPLYEHDCKNCVFLGHYQGADLYFCPRPWKTFIARYSSEGSEYDSGLDVSENDFLIEAQRRAVDLGLYPSTK